MMQRVRFYFMQDSRDKILGAPPRSLKKILTWLYVSISYLLVISFEMEIHRVLGTRIEPVLRAISRNISPLLFMQVIIIGAVLALDSLSRTHGEKAESPLGMFIIFGFVSLLMWMLQPQFA
jgi:hypothetical protein